MRGVLAAKSRRAILFLSVAAAVGLAAPGWGSQTLTRVTVTAEPARTVVVLSTDAKQPLAYTSFTLANPSRLVLDFADTHLAAELPSTYPAASAQIRQFRLGQFGLDPDVVRLVVDLSGDRPAPPWQVLPGDQAGETRIVFGKAGPLALPPPKIEQVKDAVLVRLSGAGTLPREVGTVGGPPRVYADLTGADAGKGLALDCDESPLRQVRFGQQTAGPAGPVARVVIELSKEQAHSVYSDGDDLVIAVGPQAWALPLPTYAGAGRLKGKIVVVDPGHGGYDTGAPAGPGRPPKEPYEKDIVLDLAQRLARVLQAEGAAVTMTRDDDTYVALPDRAAVANRLQADALISLHCNSCEDPDTLKGTSVYYDHPHSLELAQLVQRELIGSLGTVDKGVRNANFAVIRRTLGPGILVETGFINHAGDRVRLSHPNFRERAARAIVRGLAQYLSNNSTERNAKE